MTNNNAYDRVTERILDLMQRGTCPWRQPWSTHFDPPQNFATHRRYSGMNFFMLSMSGYQSPYFLTFRQIQELGGSVKKGSHGFPIVFWSTSEVEAKNEPVNEGPEPFVDPNKGKFRLVPFLKSYVVFNAEQIENVAFPAPPSASERPFNPIQRAEEIIRDWKDMPETLHGYPKAYYRPDNDKIYLPNPQDFERPERYYETRFHEMGHATGAPQRLNRQIRNRYGNEAYSREELVAEMTSAFLCAQCGIDNAVIESQASYLAGWMKAISDDHRLIVTAASNAQRAANYIQGITKEIPTVDRAKALAQEMEMKEMARDIARERRPNYGKDIEEKKEMTMTMD